MVIFVGVEFAQDEKPLKRALVQAMELALMPVERMEAAAGGHFPDCAVADIADGCEFGVMLCEEPGILAGFVAKND